MQQTPAIVRLLKAVVTYNHALSKDSDGSDDGEELIGALTELQNASVAMFATLTLQEKQWLVGQLVVA